MDFAAGVAVNLVTEVASRTFDSFRSEDKTEEYKQSLAINICLARAIINDFSQAQTIRNEHLKKWCSDLIVAVDEGEIALQSSTTDARALKSALSKIENLNSKANTYLMLFKSEKKAAVDAVWAAARDLAAVDGTAAFKAAFEAAYEAALAGISKTPTFVAPRSTSDNPNLDPWFKLYKSEKKEALSSPAAAGNQETPPFIAFTPAIDDSDLSRWYTSSFSFSPTERELYFFHRKSVPFIIPDCKTELGTKYRMPMARTRSQTQQYFCPVSKMPKMITGGISKNHRRFVKYKDALTCMESYPEGTGFPSDTIYNGEHSINNRMKMKGKYPECEFDEQTGYGKASMPTWSCFTPSSCIGASKYISPYDNIFDEYDGCLSQAGTSDEQTGYGDAGMPAISCFPSSSCGGASNHISPSFDAMPEENNGGVGDVSKKI